MSAVQKVLTVQSKLYLKDFGQISKAAQAGDSAAQSKLLNFKKAVGGAESLIKMLGEQ